MSLKYVISSMKRHKLRTLVVFLALIVGVALVGALLALVDTQRQFSLQVIGTQTGGYDLDIKHSDTATSPYFETAPVDQIVRASYSQVAATYPRIQGSAEARLGNSVQGAEVTIIALDVERDHLVEITTGAGSYPPGQGQVFLEQKTAALLQAQVGDEIRLSYVRPTAREVGKAAAGNTSTARAQASFTVAGVGLAGGLNNSAAPVVLMRLQDAQDWLGIANQAERLVVVWNSDTAAGSDAKVAVSRARDTGDTLKDALQQKLGGDFIVELPKYERLDNSAQGFIFQQIAITLYGLLSMGIIGLMVNALMMTTVSEQKYDLAVLRVIGAPRTRLFETVIIEVLLLGLVGIVFGLLLGRIINDNIITPLLLRQLNLPPGVRAGWTLQSVLTPTLITALVLAIATINPARTAAATKVMVVLNPAAADQPTLEELTKRRERHANYGLLVGGLVILAFCGVVLFVVPLAFSFGDITLLATFLFATMLLTIIGLASVFFFVTTPLERIILAFFSLLDRRAAFFASRYALRGKGRNSLISLMVVASAILPCWLGTQLALEDANLETDLKFQRGAPAQARYLQPGSIKIFDFGTPANKNLSVQDLTDLGQQPGIDHVAGVAEDYHDEVSDQVLLRHEQAAFIGVQGDLKSILYAQFMQWEQGDASALTRIATDPDAVIISGGLSEVLDLKVGDTLRVKGAGFDHERMMTIVAVGTRLPGFSSITRNSNTARGGSTSILMNIDTYRELRHDPQQGAADLSEALFTRALLSVAPGVDESTLGNAMRESFSRDRGIDIGFTREIIDSIRKQLEQQRIIITVLASVSMITAIFGVLAVMYTAVMNRRVEIGMLKALGAPGRSLRAIFVGEAIVTTLAAALAGIIAGTLLGYILGFSQRFAQETPMVLAFDATTAVVILVLVCVAAIFSALLATLPVLRQKAVRVLRER